MNSHPDITSDNTTGSVINKEVDQQHQVTKPKRAATRKQKMHSNLSPPAPPPISAPSRQPIIGLRRPPDAIPRQIREIRLQYEGKIKRLTSESQEWKRKYIQTTNSMTSARTRAEQVVTKLRSTIDQMKSDKKQLQRTMKQDNDRLRDQLAAAELEIQQLKRKEVVHLDARKKLDDTNEQQQAMLKKRHEQTLQVNQQMRHLNTVLRKAANEGTFLNEAALERLLAQASTLSASPLQRQLSRSPPPPSPLPAMD
jgi:myosin heavy subunit